MVGLLFEEFVRCSLAESAAPWDWEEEPVCGGLPPRFAAHYGPRFVGQLILAAGVVTGRLSGEWTAPASVIEELATWLLLDQAAVVIDMEGVKVDPGWRDELEGLLLQDLDVELLYESIDNAELVEMAGEHYLPGRWCVPFDEHGNQAPYITDDP